VIERSLEKHSPIHWKIVKKKERKLEEKGKKGERRRGEISLAGGEKPDRGHRVAEQPLPRGTKSYEEKKG